MDAEQFAMLMGVSMGCLLVGYIVGFFTGRRASEKHFFGALNVFVALEAKMRKQLVDGTDILRRLLWEYRSATDADEPRNYDLCDEAEKYINERFANTEKTKDETSTRKV